MTAPKSVPAPAPMIETDEASRLGEKAELIERLAIEMRLKSGGELPHSFCVAQVRRQLVGRSAPAAGKALPPGKASGPAGRSVFHAWALPE